MCLIEAEMVHILRELEGGKTVADVCRAYGASEEVVRSWLRRYRGMEPSEIRLRLETAAGNRGGGMQPAGATRR